MTHVEVANALGEILEVAILALEDIENPVVENGVIWSPREHARVALELMGDISEETGLSAYYAEEDDNEPSQP